MDSKPNAHNLLLALGAIAISGAAFYLSEGLSPAWWAMWLAAVPVLWIAPRLSWRKALFAALASRVIGGLSMWEYHQRLQLPLWLRLFALVVPAAAFSVAVLAFRWLLGRRRPWHATLAFPAVMISYEYCNSAAFGTFGATAYTQLNNLAVVQFAALTGLWGVGFIVMLFASLFAAICLTRGTTRKGLIGAFAVVYGFVFAYGILRLHRSPAEHTTVVGLLVSDLPRNVFPQNDAEALQLLRAYAEQVKPLAERGAKIVVIPEMTALVHDPVSADVDALFQEAARNANVEIVAGVLHVTSNAAFNEARMYSETGGRLPVYRKHHLVPVVEGRTTPADDIALVSQSFGRIGLEICRDMDYADPARRYGQVEAGLVLVPAWDFDVDRLWHGHMAIMRGIENGFSVVRAAKQGLLTVSDNRGRILAETEASSRESFTTLLSPVPVQHQWTLYQSWGDWFAWVILAMFIEVLGIIVKESVSPSEVWVGQQEKTLFPSQTVL